MGTVSILVDADHVSALSALLRSARETVFNRLSLLDQAARGLDDAWSGDRSVDFAEKYEAQHRRITHWGNQLLSLASGVDQTVTTVQSTSGAAARAFDRLDPRESQSNV